MNRLDVMDQVLSCEACDLAAKCTAPVFLSGLTPNGIVILGEAPGATEDKMGEPFVGESGQLLRDHLTQVDIDPGTVTFINTVQCWPDGTPTREHIDACEPNRTAQLELADPKFVLCVGKIAVKVSNPMLDLQCGRGRPWLRDGRVWMGTFHPAAALRNSNVETMFHDNLLRFADMTRSEDWTEFVQFTCSACPNDMCWLGEDHLGWCEQHLPPTERVARDRFMGTLV